jgi:hypothetical protein
VYKIYFLDKILFYDENEVLKEKVRFEKNNHELEIVFD